MSSLAGNKSLNSRAMLIMSSAMLFVPVMDILAKYLATHFFVSPATITFSRFIVQALLLFVVVAIRLRTPIITAKKPAFNIVRGFLIGSASTLFFTAVKYMPVADAISIFFVEPILVMFLSWLLLGESVGWRRVVAAGFGFFGAMLVIQPSFEQFGLVTLLPICTAFLFACYLILTRKFGADDHPLTMQFYSGIGGVIFCGALLLIGENFGIEDFSFNFNTALEPMLWLLVVGLIATSSHLLIVISFSMAPASTLAPFQYVEIISATILGLLIFGNFPDPLQWLGTSIIIASGLFIFWRERNAVDR